MEALLAKHHVGALALAFHDRVALTLVNYVYADRWIYARLEDGPDLTMLKHHQWVALEVNEIEGIYDWRSVTVNGSVRLLRNEQGSAAGGEFHTALEQLRSVDPAAFTRDDPMPERVQLIRIHVDEMAGREARSKSAGGLPSA